MSCSSCQLSCSMLCLDICELTSCPLPCGLLQRISAYGPQINAVREVNPDIVAEAAAMDAMLPAYQSGVEEMPLLFCVPMLVKDNFDTSREPHLSVYLHVSPRLCGHSKRSLLGLPSVSVIL